MKPWNRGHTLALLLASASMGISRVTETADGILVEYGDGPPPAAPPALLNVKQLCAFEPAPSKGPTSRRRFPVRR